MLNFSPSNPPPKSRIGNKRVAFPLGASTTSQQVLQPAPSAGSGAPCIEELYMQGSKNFCTLLQSVESEGIKEQVLELLSSWHSGKFSTNVQKLLTDLSVYLTEGNSNGVNEVHLKLAMTNEPLIKNYLPALKSLNTKTSV